MDNGIAFTDWVNDSMKDQDVKTAIFQIMEHNEKLRAAGDAMAEAIQEYGFQMDAYKDSDLDILYKAIKAWAKTKEGK